MTRAMANVAFPILVCLIAAGIGLPASGGPEVFSDPQQDQERTCFQTHVAWRGDCDLRSDVAIVYGFDSTMTQRVQSWREHGYRVHLMTGVAWGNYQDYLHGQFDGHHHEDEEQTDRNGHAHGHGGGAYYMSPSTNYGNYLCAGVRRALEAGVEAVHLEEPEFWVQDGYSEGFKREWQQFYGEPWQAPHSSVDAQWRASNLKYFLYRRTLQQVFDSVLEFNRQTGRHVRCYVPTHSLINYASWGIVSPESSLPASTAATATSRKFGPARRAHPMCIAARAGSARLKPPSWNMARCRIWSAPPDAPSGI